jgi:hypothetical protein
MTDYDKELVASLKRRRDHLEKAGADPAKLAEINFELRNAGYDESDERASKPRARSEAPKSRADEDKPKARDEGDKPGAERKPGDYVLPEVPKGDAKNEAAPKGRSAPEKSKT